MGNRNTINNSLINFYREGNEYFLEVRDLDRASPGYYSVKTFSYTSEIEADEGDLLLLEDTVLVAPHNKMLNLIDGEWYLNDFTSTTPEIEVEVPEDIEGEKASATFEYLLPSLVPPQNTQIRIKIGNQEDVFFTSATPIPIIVARINSNFEGYQASNISIRKGKVEKTTIGNVGTIPFSVEILN